MEQKNLDIVMESPRTVTLIDGTKINIKPMPVMEGLEFLDQVKDFKKVITTDLINNRDKIFSVVDMLIKRSDYPTKKDWKKDERISLQVLQDIVDAGIDANLPKSKAPQPM